MPIPTCQRRFGTFRKFAIVPTRRRDNRHPRRFAILDPRDVDGWTFVGQRSPVIAPDFNTPENATRLRFQLSKRYVRLSLPQRRPEPNPAFASTLSGWSGLTKPRTLSRVETKRCLWDTSDPGQPPAPGRHIDLDTPETGTPFFRYQPREKTMSVWILHLTPDR